MFKIDENREEDIDLEEDEEETPAEDEEEDSDSDAEKEEEKEESDEDESEEESDDEKEEEGDDEEEGGKEKSKFTMPEKFKGKSAEEIAKAYQNLEGMVATKALEMAQQFLTKKGIKAKEEDKGDDDEFDLGLTDEEIAKMSPKDFARHLNRKITEKATEIMNNAMERSTEVKKNVSREIREATKAHPHLKENKEYREIVLSLIEAANAKGKVITLKEACAKADKAMNIKPGEKKEEKKPEEKKKNRTAVEKQDGGDGGKMKTDEDRVKEGILGAGNNSSTVLGGLGV